MATLLGLSREVERIRKQVRVRTAPPSPTLARLQANAILPFEAMGWKPDPWQTGFLTSEAKRESLLCSRQAGKSTTTAARVTREANLHPKSDCLVFCPTMRQSQEMLRKVKEFHGALGKPVAIVSETKSILELANGSRIVCLPDSQEGVVGFSAPRLIVIDEGARVSDELYKSVRPMLATSSGSLLTLSTPFGNQGWFFGIWDESAEGRAKRAKLNEPWRRTPVPADQIPRITPEFLADERVELGERWYRQEYELRFLDQVDAVFAQAIIEGARGSGIEPLFDMGA